MGELMRITGVIIWSIGVMSILTKKIARHGAHSPFPRHLRRPSLPNLFLAACRTLVNDTRTEFESFQMMKQHPVFLDSNLEFELSDF